jgi:hypothetical protein
MNQVIHHVAIETTENWRTLCKKHTVGERCARIAKHIGQSFVKPSKKSSVWVCIGLTIKLCRCKEAMRESCPKECQTVVNLRSTEYSKYNLYKLACIYI